MSVMRPSSSYRPHTRKRSLCGPIFLLLPTVLLAVLSQSGCGLTSGGTLVISPTSLNFGNVAVGSSSNQSLTLTKSGTDAITLMQIAASSGSFTLKGPTLPLTLSGGQSATFTITFAPSSMGRVSGNLSITTSQSITPRASPSSAPFAPVVTTQMATLTMTAAGVPATPSITTQPASQTITAGQAATFTVTATGAAPLSYQWKKNGTAIS